jgi:hypothetical protein
LRSQGDLPTSPTHPNQNKTAQDRSTDPNQSASTPYPQTPPPPPQIPLTTGRDPSPAMQFTGGEDGERIPIAMRERAARARGRTRHPNSHQHSHGPLSPFQNSPPFSKGSGLEARVSQGSHKPAATEGGLICGTPNSALEIAKADPQTASSNRTGHQKQPLDASHGTPHPPLPFSPSPATRQSTPLPTTQPTSNPPLLPLPLYPPLFTPTPPPKKIQTGPGTKSQSAKPEPGSTRAERRRRAPVANPRRATMDAGGGEPERSFLHSPFPSCSPPLCCCGAKSSPGPPKPGRTVGSFGSGTHHLSP